uniref:Splicing factor Cactin n=1 Tax=Panagrolaimus superbus TaxID=310955 RepID=A0A914XVI1_9BILA
MQFSVYANFLTCTVIWFLQHKNYEELVKLESDVQNKIRTETNVGFWQYLLDELRPYMAKSRLKAKHAAKQALKLQRIREEQAKEMDEHQKLLGDIKPVLPKPKMNESKTNVEPMETDETDCMEITEEDAVIIKKQTFKSIPFTFDELKAMDDDVQEQKWSLLNDAQLELFTEHLYVQGRYSPVLGTDGEAMPGIEVIDEVDDFKQLQAARKRNRNGDAEPITSAEADFMRMARSGMEKEEEEFIDEEKLEKQTYLWSDKYRPRKPRYFNRVHTGFDWNKYNQTHYDLDNPPPKIVQGYRFNIFYPDLLDITHTPQYTLTECEDSDFAILRFKAGPPYEDIAFKIVNREWEINHKHGFRNQFKEGVFQLWFFFKRYRYRR